MTDRIPVDTNNFEGLAFGVFDSSNDLDSGRAALLQAYQSYDWDDKERALSILEDYGDALKFKLKDQSSFGDAIIDAAPVKLTDVPITEDMNDLDVYDRWEELNTEYLSKATEPEYVVARKQLLNDVKQYATQQRRITGQKNLKDNTDAMLGETGGAILRGAIELNNRFVQGAASGAEWLINSAVNIFTDGYELNSQLTEMTDPEKDGKFISNLAGGAGSVAGVITSSLAGPLGFAAYTGGQAIDAIGTRYQETARKTGDTGEAVKAAGIETVSQGVQILGERAVFGKFARGIFGKETGVVKDIAKSAAQEAAAEGTGQAISNIAENIEVGNNPKNIKDGNLSIWRNTGQAAVIGGLLAGGTSGAAFAFPSKGNNTQRASEITQYGEPITPVTSQQIGNINPSEPVNNEWMVLSFHELNEPGLNLSETIVSDDGLTGYVYQRDPLFSPPTLEPVPAFTTDDGTTHIQTGENQFAKDGQLPLDKSFFVSEEGIKAVATAITNGEHIVLNGEGNPAIERTNEDGTKTYEDINSTVDPTVGSYPLYISEERSPNSQQIVRPVQIGQRIREVTLDTSMGAAGPRVRVQQRESTYSQKLRSPDATVPDEMKQVGVEGLFYTPISQVDADPEALAYINRVGVEKAAAEVQNPEFNIKIKGPVSRALHNYINRSILEQKMQGNFDAATQLGQLFKGILAPAIGESRTQLAQGLALAGQLDGFESVNTAFDTTFEASIAEQAEQEGVTPLEIAQSKNNLVTIDKDIQSAQAEVLQAEEADRNYLSEEDRAIDQVVSDIEAQAQERLTDDLSTIEEESTGITTEINQIEKKAIRTKGKDITAIEGAIATDSEELLKALSDAQDIKDVTQEEADRLNQTITDSIEAAASKANSEVTQAVKTERARQETERKTRLELAEDRVSKAQDGLEATKVRSQERLRKLKIQERQAQRDGEPTEPIQQKITDVEDRITRAAQRVVDAKENLRVLKDELAQKTEAQQEADDLYDELESGIEVRVVPVGKKRRVSVVTKRSGMDITKLFNQKSAAYEPLTALSRGVNELTNVMRQGLGAKAENNTRISELQKRINANKRALDRTKARDPLSPSEQKKVNAAKKRLAELDQAKTEATLESRIPKAKRESYKRYKDRQKSSTRGRNESPETKEAKRRVAELERERKRVERLAQRREEAIRKAAEAAKISIETQRQINELQKMLDDKRVTTPSDIQKVKARIKTLRASNLKNPPLRYHLANGWAADVIPGYIIGTISLIASTVSVVANPIAFAVGDVVKNGYDLITNNVKGRTPLSVEYLKGVLGAQTLSRAATLGKIAFTTGDRVSVPFNRSEISVANIKDLNNNNSPIRNTFVEAIKDLNNNKNDFIEAMEDFYTHSKNLTFSKEKAANNKELVLLETKAQKLYGAWAKAVGALALPGSRILSALEAFTFTAHQQGFDRAAAARYYDAARRTKVKFSDIDTKKVESRHLTDHELDLYKYSPQENWSKAEAFAQTQADELRKAGINVTPKQQRITAFEYYQQIAPREIGLSAYKQAAELVGNGPAQGAVGLISDLIQAGVNIVDRNVTSPVGRPVVIFVQIATKFANSIAQFANAKIAWTPWGALDAIGRTDFEKDLIRSQALTGTIAGVALLAVLRAGDDDPGKPNAFDIVSNDGGYTYDLKIRDTYIKTTDWPLALWFLGVGKARDAMRKGEDPDTTLSTTAMMSAFTMAGSTLTGFKDTIQMAQGISNLFKAIEAAGEGQDNWDIELVRSLMNPIKGFVPGASLWKTAARFFDNPVMAKKDIMSAMVEGFPVLQSAYGKAALNVFGEPIPAGKDDPDLNVHRVFSTKPTDIDMRWLIDNGYTTPALSRMVFPSSIKNYIANTPDAKKTDYDMKHQVFQRASKDLREVVSNYRQAFGMSAHRDDVQKALNKDFNGVLAAYAEQVYSEQMVSR